MRQISMCKNEGFRQKFDYTESTLEAVNCHWILFPNISNFLFYEKWKPCKTFPDKFYLTWEYILRVNYTFNKAA